MDDDDEPLQFRILPLVQPTANGAPVDQARISRLCAIGLSECPAEDRCIAWLVLLGVYPSNPSGWSDHCEELVSSYRSHLSEFEMENWHTQILPPNLQRRDLNLKDTSLMWIIHADIHRTTRHIYFLPPLDPPDGAQDDIHGSFLGHIRRLERILYVFGSLNPLRYHQGFNELILPLYYTNYAAIRFFNRDPDEVEAITFHCFSALINSPGVNSYYTAQGDLSALDQKMDLFRDLMRKHLPDVQQTLEVLGVSPILFSMRWFGLLFGQDCQLPVLLIVWDALFAHIKDLMNYVAYVAVARVRVLSGKVTRESLAETMTALQEPMTGNVYPMLRDAYGMYQMDHEPPSDWADEIVSFFKRLF
jgi:hypothetical protein